MALVTASVVPAQGREVGTRHLVLNYEVYVGGFRSASVAYDAWLGAADYDLRISLDGRGILDWWFAWTMNAFSQGWRNGHAIDPVRAGRDTTWNGKRRRARLNYLPDGPPIVQLYPRRGEDDPVEVAPALREGTRDLAAALFALVSRIGDSARCDGREAVFDGRRRYNLVLTHLGEARLPPSSYAAYAGPALRCGLTVERIAGYPADSGRSSWRTDKPAVVWVARIFDGQPPVPVRLEYDTRIGALVGHLVRATLNAEGAERLVLAR